MKLFKYLIIGLFLGFMSMCTYILVSKNLLSIVIINKKSIIFFDTTIFTIYFIFIVKEFLLKKILYLVIFLSLGFIVIYQLLGFLFFSGLVKDLIFLSTGYLSKTITIFVLLVTVQLLIVFSFILIKKIYIFIIGKRNNSKI